MPEYRPMPYVRLLAFFTAESEFIVDFRGAEHLVSPADLPLPTRLRRPVWSFGKARRP